MTGISDLTNNGTVEDLDLFVIQSSDNNATRSVSWATMKEVAPGIPIGGTTGQQLTKNSDDDYDAVWSDAFDEDRVRSYATLDAAIADIELEVGDSILTLGYTSTNDDGGAHYVVSTGGVADGILIVDMTNGLQLDRLSIPNQIFDTVADAIAAEWLGIGDSFTTLGYTTKNDGGSGEYYISASTGTDNGGSRIDLTGGSGLQAQLIIEGDYPSTNLMQWGANKSGATDTQPILQGILDEFTSNMRIDFPSDGTFLFTTNQTFLAPQLTAVTFGIALDGLQNIHLNGNGCKITFGGDLAQDGHIWLGIYTSDVQAAAISYSENIKVTGFFADGNRPDGVTKFQTFALIASTDGAIVEDIHLIGDWNNGSSSIIQGDNNQRFYMERCSGFGLSTPFDIANFEDTHIDNVLFDSRAGNGVTGFNLFYAPLVYGETNLQRAYREGYGSNVKLGTNAVFVGFSTACRIEAQKNTTLSGIFSESVRTNSTGSRGISITTDPTAEGLGFFTDGVIISNAQCYKCTSNVAGLSVGIFVEDDPAIANIRIIECEIYDNDDRGVLAGNSIVNFLEFNNDYDTRDASGIQTINTGSNTIFFTGGGVGVSGPTIGVESPSADAPLNLEAKGTGKINLNSDLKFGTRVPNADALITGYIEITDTSNITRKLAIID